VIACQLSVLDIRCQVSGVKYQCQILNMSVSGKLNTEPQYHMLGNHPIM